MLPSIFIIIVIIILIKYWFNNQKYDDDVIDRLNYSYTVLLLIAIFVFTAYMYSEPIDCRVPAELARHKKDVDHYCLLESTYYVSFDHGEQIEMQYYQWVPAILVLQILLFVVPKAFWNAVSWKTGLRLMSCLGELNNAQDEREITSKLAWKIRVMVVINNNLRQARLFVNYSWKHYFTTSFLIFKILNLMNTLFQMMMIYKFLNFKNFGTETYCDFMIHHTVFEPATRYTFPCYLLLIGFNEKLFSFIFLWCACLTLLNLCNLVYWVFISTSASSKTNFIKAQLNFAGVEYDASDIPKFAEHWITLDGVTAFRIVSANAGDAIASKIIYHMYRVFCVSAHKDGKRGLAANEAKDR